MTPFKVHSNYAPAGDQPQAIEKLTASIIKGNRCNRFNIEYFIIQGIFVINTLIFL